MRLELVALTALLSVARAEPVTVVTPTASGEGSVSVAAGLAAAIDAALAKHSRWTRAGEQALLPDELTAVFGCLSFDRPCARQAGMASGAAVVLFGEVGRVGPRYSIELVLLRVRDGADVRSVRRIIRQQGDPAELRGGLELALEQLVDLVLEGPSPLHAAIVLPGAVSARTADGDPLPARTATPVAPGPYALEFANDTQLAVTVGRDEALVLAAPHPVASPGLSPLGMAAWMTAGGSAVAFASAGFFGLRLTQEQSDYDSRQDPEDLLRHSEQGEAAANATTALLITGGAAATVSLILFLLDD